MGNLSLIMYTHSLKSPIKTMYLKLEYMYNKLILNVL